VDNERKVFIGTMCPPQQDPSSARMVIDKIEFLTDERTLIVTVTDRSDFSRQEVVFEKKSTARG